MNVCIWGSLIGTCSGFCFNSCLVLGFGCLFFWKIYVPGKVFIVKKVKFYMWVWRNFVVFFEKLGEYMNWVFFIILVII